MWLTDRVKDIAIHFSSISSFDLGDGYRRSQPKECSVKTRQARPCVESADLILCGVGFDHKNFSQHITFFFGVM